MNDVKNKLELYRDLKITKNELKNTLDKIRATANLQVAIDSKHIINVLTSYKTKQISKFQLVEWVNTIWFSDYYDYNDNEAEAIAIVMNYLEELDEKNHDLSEQEIKNYISILKRH